MAYLVDGHNLIPKLGISLSDLDDEKALLHILQQFSRLKRKKVEVYFDQAAPGFAGVQRYGRVTAVFVRSGSEADQAISARLRKMGRSAANWVVVSSDHLVQAEARALHAKSLSSEEFAQMVRSTLANAQEAFENTGMDSGGLSENEIEEWLRIFRDNV